MNGQGKSDRSIVPEKPPNKGRGPRRPAEAVEGRGRAKGNAVQQTRDWTLGQKEALQQALDRIRQAAKDKEVQLTALWHHVYNVDRLEQAFFAMKREAAPGVDGVTWRWYRKNLRENLEDLSDRLRRGAYRARPVRRTYIPKADGRQRPLGVPTLEDKLVQRVCVEVLNAVYEGDFCGFSYGYRPGRGAHDALDALTVAIENRPINWVLDADLRGFFDTLDHEWLVRMLEHRIRDKRVIRHVKKWLKAGVLEDGGLHEVEAGTPQGGSISPLLANVYLHYVLDQWVAHWRKKRARGEVIVVRYADDFVVGFEDRGDAERFRAELTERLRKFSLELHPDKTRLIEFGRHADRDRRGRGDGKPETFDFLGFTHICSKSRRGRFRVLRRTSKKRMRAKLQAIKVELRRRLHDPVWQVGCWLRQVVTGYYRYFAVPNNLDTLRTFRYAVLCLWRRVLRRRSQRSRVTWARMTMLSTTYLPYARVLHPYPDRRLRVTTRGRSPVR